MRYHYIPIRTIKILKILKNWWYQVLRRIKSNWISYIAGRKAKWYSPLKTVWQFLLKRNIYLPFNPEISHLRYLLLYLLSYRNLFRNVYSYFTHNWQKQKKPKRPSTGRWLNKLWYIHKMKYYSAIYFKNSWYNMEESHMHYAKWKKLDHIP